MSASSERKYGAILSYVSLITSIIIQLICTPILVRFLGQSEYGLYSLSISIIGYLSILDMGFGNAIIVYASRYRTQDKKEEEQKLYGMFLIIYFVIGIISTIIGLLIYFYAPVIFKNGMNPYEISKMQNILLILTFNLALSFPLSVYSSIINAYEKFTFQKIISLIGTLLKPLLMIPLLFLGYKSLSMAIIVTVANLFVMFSNYFYCTNRLNIKMKFGDFDKKLFNKIMAYSFFVFLNAVVDKINWSADQFILGTICGTVAVSVYSIAGECNSLLIGLSTGISGVLLPKMAKMVAMKSSNKDLSDEFIKVGRLQFLILFLVLSGFVLFGKEFVILWAGQNYVESYYIALVLMIPVFIPLIQNLGISILQAKNLHKFRSILYMFVAIFNIIISIPLAKMYGGIGAAWGTAISLIIGNIFIINIYYYKKAKLDIPRFWKEIFGMLVYYVLPILLMIVLTTNIYLQGKVYLFVWIITYTIVYSFVSYYFVMNSYEKNLLKRFKNKILSRK